MAAERIRELEELDVSTMRTSALIATATEISCNYPGKTGNALAKIKRELADRKSMATEFAKCVCHANRLRMEYVRSLEDLFAEEGVDELIKVLEHHEESESYIREAQELRSHIEEAFEKLEYWAGD